MHYGAYQAPMPAQQDIEQEPMLLTDYENAMFMDFVSICRREQREESQQGGRLRAWKVAQERGSDGRYHLQVALYLPTGQRFSYLKRMFQPVFDNIHWEIARKFNLTWDYVGREGKDGWVSVIY